MALAFLASCPRNFCSVREIVEELNLPKRLLAEVLKSLSKADLVDATRGPGGGYRLSEPAESIPLSRVVEILEGSVALADCGGSCTLQPSCLIQTGIGKVTQSIRQVLDSISVADLLPPATSSEKSEAALQV
jgi:Rrf2 family protein